MMRYGHQQYSEIMAMPYHRLIDVYGELMDMVNEENRAGVVSERD